MCHRNLFFLTTSHSHYLGFNLHLCIHLLKANWDRDKKTTPLNWHTVRNVPCCFTQQVVWGMGVKHTPPLPRHCFHANHPREAYTHFTHTGDRFYQCSNQSGTVAREVTHSRRSEPGWCFSRVSCQNVIASLWSNELARYTWKSTVLKKEETV